MPPKRPFPEVPFTWLFLFLLLLLNSLTCIFPSPIVPLQVRPSNLRPTRQSKPQAILGQRISPETENLPRNEGGLSPPHCSRATVTLAESSKLTKRAAVPFRANSSRSNSKSTQLSLNIGIGQTVCFTMAGQNDAEKGGEEGARESASNEAEVFTVPKSNFSFIVALTKPNTFGRAKARTAKAQKAALEDFNPERVLHSITVLDLEQYHAILERYRFAIPELETRCVCECESGTANCAAERYKYGQCEQGEEEEGAQAGDVSGERLAWTASPRRGFSSPSACYRTFFANQPTGRHCSRRRDESSSSSRLCCQLHFRPFGKRSFTALRLENAVSSVLLQYSQWGWRDVEEGEEAGNGTRGRVPGGRHWLELDRRKVRVQLDGAVHNTVLSEQAGLKLSVLGLGGANSGAAQLEAGVYFAENQEDGSLGELTGQMPVNRITEHDFHKLGWLRLDDRGQPFVQSGEVFLDKIHHARVDDCAEQRFRSVLDASYYVNADNNASTQFKLAEPLSSMHKWVRSARVLDSNQRIALVRAREGLSLEITLTADQKPSEMEAEGREQGGRLLTFVHNSSRLADFTAMLVIDRFSNSFLNLTLFNSTGVLNGYVRPLNEPEGAEIDGFSVNVPSREELAGANALPDALPVSLQVRIKPYPLGSIHIVCLRPDEGEMALELCRPVQSVYHELEVNTVSNGWSEAVGACKKCNQITAEGFAKYLNPANWAKGISSVSEALMLISDIIGYFIAILIVYGLLCKVVFPLLGCCCTACLGPTGGFFFGRSAKK